MSSLIERARGPVRSLLPTRADLALIGRDPRRDLLTGLTVAIVAPPLALGFGISSGLGAEAGLATAVVAGALALRTVAEHTRLEQVPLASGIKPGRLRTLDTLRAVGRVHTTTPDAIRAARTYLHRT